MDTCIRALCNSDVKREGFQLGKDVSLVETYIQSPQNPLREIGGKPASHRDSCFLRWSNARRRPPSSPKTLVKQRSRHENLRETSKIQRKQKLHQLYEN